MIMIMITMRLVPYGSHMRPHLMGILQLRSIFDIFRPF
jgi:hypothetical protein